MQFLSDNSTAEDTGSATAGGRVGGGGWGVGVKGFEVDGVGRGDTGPTATAIDAETVAILRSTQSHVSLEL